MNDKEFVLSIFANATCTRSTDRFNRGWHVEGKNADGSNVFGYGGIAAQAWAKAARRIRQKQKATDRSASIKPVVLGNINEIAAQHGVDPSTVRQIIAQTFKLARDASVSTHEIESIVNEQ
jgi:hypothetical protein